MVSSAFRYIAPFPRSRLAVGFHLPPPPAAERLCRPAPEELPGEKVRVFNAPSPENGGLNHDLDHPIFFQSRVHLVIPISWLSYYQWMCLGHLRVNSTLLLGIVFWFKYYCYLLVPNVTDHFFSLQEQLRIHTRVTTYVKEVLREVSLSFARATSPCIDASNSCAAQCSLTYFKGDPWPFRTFVQTNIL